jgi:Putative Flp pilus-assembly TadE/G-like
MRRLTGRRGQERGAVAVIVAMVVGMFVLTGVAALSIDAGSLYAERRVVQNSADAASLLLAQACARGDTTICSGSLNDLTRPSAAKDTLLSLAGLNSPDRLTDIASVCGSVAPFMSCGTPLTNPKLVDCTVLPSPAPANWVEVRTKTLSTGADPSVVRKYFARGPDSSYDGVRVKACARAAWGPAGPVGSFGFPVTFSYCDWQANTGADPLAKPPVPGRYQPSPAQGRNPGYGPTAPDTPWPAAGSEVTLWSAGHGSPVSCTTWNGHVAPGNFGTLINTGCNVTVDNGWVHGDTGVDKPCGDADLLTRVGTIIYIPVFDCDTTTEGDSAHCKSAHGSGDWYHISGYAAFYLTGYYFSSTKLGGSIFPPDGGAAPCKGNDRCISGWFTSGSLNTTFDNTGAPGFGANAVQVAG